MEESRTPFCANALPFPFPVPFLGRRDTIRAQGKPEQPRSGPGRSETAPQRDSPTPNAAPAANSLRSLYPFRLASLTFPLQFLIPGYPNLPFPSATLHVPRNPEVGSESSLD